MPPFEGIRKLGFRRWHERQLIESHAYLVTGFMSMIMVLACSEGFNFRALGGKSLLMLLAILGGIVLCVVSLRLYLFILFRAEHLAEQSACGGCGSYGLLRITSAASGVEAEEETLGVQCRKCGHRWTIGLGRSD